MKILLNRRVFSSQIFWEISQPILESNKSSHLWKLIWQHVPFMSIHTTFANFFSVTTSLLFKLLSIKWTKKLNKMNKCEMEIIEMKSWNKKTKKTLILQKNWTGILFSDELWTEMNLAKLKFGPFKTQNENSISIYFWNLTVIKNFWKFLWNFLYESFCGTFKSLRKLNLLNFHT